MPFKIENATGRNLPKSFGDTIQTTLAVLPKEHLRGLDRVRIVSTIDNPRVRSLNVSQLPGLYYPKQGPQPAWIEVALDALLPTSTTFYRRIVNKLTYKSNLAMLVFSLVGQHYFLTLRHSVKKSQLEPSVRAYSEKYLRIWSAQQHKFRAKLFKPLQPTFERWARSLNRKVRQEKKS
jgi:hypothetical protein